MRARTQRASFAGAILVVVLLWASPLGVALAPTADLPADTPALTDLDLDTFATSDVPTADGQTMADWLAWTEDVAIEVIEADAAARVADIDVGLPTPDAIPGYATLTDEAKRFHWRGYLASTLVQSEANGPFTGSPFGGAAQSAQQQEEGAEGQVSALGDPRGVRGLWALESHDEPRVMYSAGDNGSTLLVTDRAVIKFDGPGQDPSWMVKTPGYLDQAEAVELTGDGVMDVVFTTWTFDADEDTLYVIDGASGAVLFSGLAGESSFRQWTLTDVDGDGTLDLLGVQYDQILAAKFDGTEIYTVPLGERIFPPVSQCVMLACWFFFYSPVAYYGFGDFDADGITDVLSADRNEAWIFGFLVFEQVSVQRATAYSGADGSVLWTRVYDQPNGFGFRYVVDTGDLDGDGADDLLMGMYRADSYGVLIGVYMRQRGYEVASGADGLIIVRDHDTLACPGVCVQSADVGMAATYIPLTIGDIDGDGAAEIVTIEAAETEVGVEAIDLVGRAVGPIEGGPSVETYRTVVQLPDYEIDDGHFLLRDADGDGTDELAFLIFGIEYDESGNITDLHTFVYIVDDQGVTDYETATRLAYWDIDEATGQAYGWDVMRDRWLPVDDEGRAIGDGLRLVMSTYPAMIRDETGDGVPDLLLRKTIGFMWVDGKTGALLDDIERPLTTYPMAVVEEKGRLRILERDFATDDYVFSDLKTGRELWRLTEDDTEDGYLHSLADMTGDGVLDVAIRVWDWGDESVPVPGGGSDGDDPASEEGLRVWDMTLREQLVAIPTDDGYAMVMDVLNKRPGEEILVRTWGWDDDTGSLSLYTVDSEEPRWTYDLGTDGDFDQVLDGYLLTTNQQEGAIVEILSATTAEMIYTYPLEADTDLTMLFFHRVNGDRFPELVMSYNVDEGDHMEQFVTVYDWARDRETAHFRLSDPETETITFGNDWVWTYTQSTYVTGAVNDWDDDGLVDFVYREADRPVVRSTGDGSILAVAPVEGSAWLTEDFNGDGIMEFGVISDTGRLRFFAYDQAVVGLVDEESVRTIENPAAPQTDDAAEEFFDANDEGRIPGPGAALTVLVVSLIALLGAVRRRD